MEASDAVARHTERRSTSRTARCASSTSSCTGRLGSGVTRIDVLNPDGAHSIAVGIDASGAHRHARPRAATTLGGMNKLADLTVHGNAGRGVAENMMSGSVRVKGFASEAAGAIAVTAACW